MCIACVACVPAWVAWVAYVAWVAPESQNDLYDVWETNSDFFEEVMAYYKDSTVVKCYEKGGPCDSDEE